MSNPLGGNPPVPLNAPPPGSGTGTAAGASAGPLRVTEIIITPGSILEGIFTYSSSPPAAGTLTESASVATAGTDAYGNHYLAGHASYAANFAAALDAGFAAFYTGSLSAGWTLAAQIETDAAGDLVLSASGAIQLAGAVTLGGTMNAVGQNIDMSMGVPTGYPYTGITVATPGGANAAYYANVTAAINALVNGANSLMGEMINRELIS